MRNSIAIYSSLDRLLRHRSIPSTPSVDRIRSYADPSHSRPRLRERSHHVSQDALDPVEEHSSVPRGEVFNYAPKLPMWQTPLRRPEGVTVDERLHDRVSIRGQRPFKKSLRTVEVGLEALSARATVVPATRSRPVCSSARDQSHTRSETETLGQCRLQIDTRTKYDQPPDLIKEAREDESR